jgi:hypothetical protein
MSEVEQRIAAMNRERAGHLWSAAVRLQREVLELRGEKAELLRVLEVWRNTFGRGGYNSKFLAETDAVIARAERLK